jgi:hypothetical protein
LKIHQEVVNFQVCPAGHVEGVWYNFEAGIAPERLHEPRAAGATRSGSG